MYPYNLVLLALAASTLSRAAPMRAVKYEDLSLGLSDQAFLTDPIALGTLMVTLLSLKKGRLSLPLRTLPLRCLGVSQRIQVLA